MFFRSISVLLVLLPLALCGCVTVDEKSRAQPLSQPDWVRASALFVNVEVPRDTNGNGYVDTIPVIAFLFDDPRYALSITQPGSFRWVLATREGQPVAKWEFGADQAAALVRPGLPPGPGYQFALSLLEEPVHEKLNNQTLELSGTFTPVSGTAVQSSGTISVRVGRAGS